MSGCGSASFGCAEVDTCTDFNAVRLYISGSNAGSLGGLLIDRTTQYNLFGGSAESCGAFGILIGSKAEAATSCLGGVIEGMTFENTTSGYIGLGAGLSGAAFVANLKIFGNTGTPSGATNQFQAIKYQQRNGWSHRDALRLSQTHRIRWVT